MPRVVELYYTVAELAFLLRFSEPTIRQRIRDGKFSPPGENGAPDFSNIKDLEGDLRIPASGVNWYLSQHPFKYDLGVKAVNTAELRRRIRKKEDNGQA